jgi:hypothetical protein
MHLRIPWPTITSALNTVLAVFVILQMGRAVMAHAEVSTNPIPEAWTTHLKPSAPDVFLILADGHGRSDVLDQRYGYDDTAFQGSMTSSGFALAENSYANQSVTNYSLAVLLNGRPLSELGQDPDRAANEPAAYVSMLASSGIDMLERAGYRATVIASGYEHVPLRTLTATST